MMSGAHHRPNDAGLETATLDNASGVNAHRARQERMPGDRSPFLYYDLRMEKIKGVPVTDEMIQQLADEAVKGYDVDQLRKRGRKPMGDGPARVVPVRLDDTLLTALDERAERDHTTRSELIRAALRAYVT